MKIYEVTAYSDCGTYFNPYLQKVLVIANNELECKGLIADIKFETKRINIECLGDVPYSPAIIYEHRDKDY